MLAFVNSASQAEVLLGMQKIKRDFLPNSAFLHSSNRLRNEPSSAIVAHFHPTNPVSLSVDDARTFLAASSFIHCKDSWQYMSNAVDAIFKGDFKTSIHLLYYSELRAAMSFLGTEGMAILNNMHFSVVSPISIVKDPKSGYNHKGFPTGSGTHSFAWDCLNTFVKSSNKKVDHLLECFWHNGLSFDQWIGFIPYANSIAVLSQIVKRWISDWSFDIGHFKDDRIGRNNASYNPSKFGNFVVGDTKVSIETYSNYLRLLEPDSSNRFSLLDKHLFKLLFKKIHGEIVSRGTTISLEALLDQTFVNARKSMDASLKGIVLSATDHPMIAAAADKILNPATGEIKPFTIFSRALLLSRVATAGVTSLLNRSSVSKNDLAFFFNYCGVHHGFWTTGSPIPDFIDLWTDLADALTDIDIWAAGQVSPLDLKIFNDNQKDNLTIYKQINRVNYWGIAI